MGMTMKGKYHVVVQNRRLHYDFTVRRNLTVIRGDSATGKTTLINMLSTYANMGENSGIEVICEKPCVVLNGFMWELFIENTHDSIIFLDEDFEFIKTIAFAEKVKASDNYFVIVTREDLFNLPYSVEEVYGIHTSGKYHDMKRTYQEFYQIYSIGELREPIKPEEVLVEDSNSGFEFFENVCETAGISCRSAAGKSNIRKCLDKSEKENVLVVADGAAFGPEMNRIDQYMKMHPAVKCYLPESFEWLILKAGIVDQKRIREILQQPEEYIESRDFFSWERFFTNLLIQSTKDTWMQYKKNQLNPAYLSEKMKNAILKVMEMIVF